MREILYDKIVQEVKKMCIDVNLRLSKDIEDAIRINGKKETHPLAKFAFKVIAQNLEAAYKNKIPICQDTGFVDVFVEMGEDVYIKGGGLKDAINEGVRLGYKEGYLRKSMVSDPLCRVNTNNNTPPIIFCDIKKGDKLKVTISPKGAGSENKSKLKMLSPTATEDDIVEFVKQTVKEAGGSACPPIVVGVGIGGDFAYCAYLAKLALSRDINVRNENERYAKLEVRLKEEIDMLNIGAQGFKGDITALGVNIEWYPTHIACLPIAINMGCHVTRHITTFF